MMMAKDNAAPPATLRHPSLQTARALRERRPGCRSGSTPARRSAQLSSLAGGEAPAALRPTVCHAAALPERAAADSPLRANILFLSHRTTGHEHARAVLERLHTRSPGSAHAVASCEQRAVRAPLPERLLKRRLPAASWPAALPERTLQARTLSPPGLHLICLGRFCTISAPPSFNILSSSI